MKSSLEGCFCENGTECRKSLQPRFYLTCRDFFAKGALKIRAEIDVELRVTSSEL
jgi:hypothetical protein